MFHCLSKPWNKPSSALSTMKLEQPLRRRCSERHLRKNTEFCAYNYLNFWYFFQYLSLFNLLIKLFVCSNWEMYLSEWFLMWISWLKVCVLHKTFNLNINSTLFCIKQTKKYTIKIKAHVDMKPFGCAVNAFVTIVVVWAPSIEKRPKMNFKPKTSSESSLFLIHKPNKIHVHKKNLLCSKRCKTCLVFFAVILWCHDLTW